MTEEYDNNNNEDHSTEASHNNRTLQNKELLKVLEALESLGFRLSDYHES